MKFEEVRRGKGYVHTPFRGSPDLKFVGAKIIKAFYKS